MISGVSSSSDNNNLIQLLLEASKNASSSSKTGSDSSSTSKVNSGGDDFLSCLESNFTAADANYDSELSEKEISAFSKLAGTQPPMGPPPGMMIEDAGATQESSEDNPISSLISSLDKDKDGTLSIDELTSSSDEQSSKTSDSKNGFTDALSNILGNGSSSSLSSSLNDLFSKKIQETYANSSMSNSSIISSAMNYII